MPAQIDRDSLVARAEIRHVRVSIAVRAAEAMNEQDRRVASDG
jgi:hypothetical protein